MATARSPLAGQEMNQPKPKEQGNVASVQQQEQAGIDKEKKEDAAVTPEQRQAQQQSGIGQAVEQVASKMGNFAHSLRARVNQLVSGAAQTTGFTQQKIVYTGAGGMKVSDAAADVDPVVAEKMRQAELLRGTLSPFATEIAGRLQAKTFGQVVKDEMGDNPEVTRMLQMVTALQDLESRGLTGSPEARAIEAQIQELDKFGLVTQLRNAMNEYNRLMGLGRDKDTSRWYGGDIVGEGGKSVFDLASLTQNEIKTEVQKAMTLSQGLFSGDFAENLKKKYDTESAEAQRAARRSEQLQMDMYNAFSVYAKEAGDEFGAAQKKIENHMRMASDAVYVALNATEQGREALQWMSALAGKEGETLVDTLMRALKDPNSGLGKEQRKEIEKFIGGVADTVPGGYFAYALKSIGETGKIPIKTAGGTTEMVELSGDQKLKLLTIMESKDLDPKQKQAQLEEVVRSIGTDSKTNIGTIVDKGLDAAKSTGSTDAALATFTASLTQSLYTFVGSRTEDAVRAALANSDPSNKLFTVGGWEGMTPDQRQALMRSVLKDRPDIIKKIREDVKTKETSDNINVQKQIDESMGKTNDAMSQIDRMLDDDADGDGNLDKSKDKNGNPIPVGGGTLISQRRRLDAVPAKLTKSIVTNTYSSLSSGVQNVIPQMTASINKEPWFAVRLKAGVISPAFVDTAAQLYAYQKVLERLSTQLPGVANAILPPDFPKDLTAIIMRAAPKQGDWGERIPLPQDGEGPGAVHQYRQTRSIVPPSPEDAAAPGKLLELLKANMAKVFPQGQPSDIAISAANESLASMTNMAEEYRKTNSLPGNVPGNQKATVLQLADWLNARDITNSNIQKAKDQRKVLESTLGRLGDFQKQLELPVYNPDELLSQVLGFSEGVEDVLSGRVPTAIEKGLGNIKPEDLTAMIPTIKDITGLGSADFSGLSESALADLFKSTATGSTTLPGKTMPAVTTPGAGSEPSTRGVMTKDKWDSFKTLLGQLGLDTKGWSMINGIPHIRMGDGKFVQWDKIPVEAGSTTYTAPAPEALALGPSSIDAGAMNLSDAYDTKASGYGKEDWSKSRTQSYGPHQYSLEHTLQKMADAMNVIPGVKATSDYAGDLLHPDSAKDLAQHAANPFEIPRNTLMSTIDLGKKLAPKKNSKVRKFLRKMDPTRW
jgi:hypothetical protein